MLNRFFASALLFLPNYTVAELRDYELQKIVGNVITLRPDGKINIPLNIKHIKLDIGLSYSAPMSQYWLTHESDLYVFGFEPNPVSVSSILNGAIKQHPHHGEPLDKQYIGKNFFLVPIALGISNSSTTQLFVTTDPGCSSIYNPKQFAIERIIQVPIFSLNNFFDLFPFDTHPVIEYIKIDAQGSDLDIVKSGSDFIAKHVIFITVEAENTEYLNTHNSGEAIDQFMRSIGFVPHISAHTSDPTYFNLRFTDYVKTNDVKIYQQG